MSTDNTGQLIAQVQFFVVTRSSPFDLQRRRTRLSRRVGIARFLEGSLEGKVSSPERLTTGRRRLGRFSCWWISIANSSSDLPGRCSTGAGGSGSSSSVELVGGGGALSRVVISAMRMSSISFFRSVKSHWKMLSSICLTFFEESVLRSASLRMIWISRRSLSTAIEAMLHSLSQADSEVNLQRRMKKQRKREWPVQCLLSSYKTRVRCPSLIWSARVANQSVSLDLRRHLDEHFPDKIQQQSSEIKEIFDSVRSKNLDERGRTWTAKVSRVRGEVMSSSTRRTLHC